MPCKYDDLVLSSLAFQPLSNRTTTLETPTQSMSPHCPRVSCHRNQPPCFRAMPSPSPRNLILTIVLTSLHLCIRRPMASTIKQGAHPNQHVSIEVGKLDQATILLNRFILVLKWRLNNNYRFRVIRPCDTQDPESLTFVPDAKDLTLEGKTRARSSRFRDCLRRCASDRSVICGTHASRG
jgi:hypothetical protein